MSPSPGSPSVSRGSAARIAIRWGLVALCLGLFVYALTRADLEAGWERIRATFPTILLVLLPFVAVLGCDSAAWSRLVGALGHRILARDVFRVRVSTEAVALSTPGGVLWAEALAPVLIARRTHAPVADAVAASAARRWLVLRMHGGYVAGAAVLGFPALSRASRQLVGSDALVLAVALGALALVLASLGVERLTARGRVAGRLSRALGGTRFRFVQSWIQGREHHFSDADAGIERLSADTRAQRAGAAALLGLWLAEGFETYLILRLLGADLGLATVMSFDAALSIVRSVAFFAPAGIGVQDIGYFTVLHAYGVPPESGIAGAFVVVKRLKELFWVLVGLALLGIRSKAAPPAGG